MRSGPRTLLFASLLAAAAVGCDHRPEDFSRVQASTEQFLAVWNGRVAELGSRQSGLFQRAQRLPPDAPGVADVLSRLTAIETEIEALGQKLEGVGQAATAKVQEKRARLADEALATGDKDLTVDLAGISTRLDEVGAQLDTLDSDAAAKAAAAAADANKPPPQIDQPEFASGLYRADVPGISFQASNLDMAATTTKAALDRIVAFANRCDALRFGITGHTAKDGDSASNLQLSEARAHAVRRYLIAKGVAEAKITQIEGAGGTQPLLPEPEAGSPEEAAMDAEQLARIRGVNRRISIQVLTPCS
jgi:outer membrane protein OmpA-like peptidoglycan-associated protein